MSHCLTMEEVHQVAFLTLHGWTLSNGEWSKPGFQREISKRHGCGCCFYEEKIGTFSLDDAYYAQLEGL
jgi:hypothetical protein